MNEPRRHLPTQGAYGEQSGKSGSRTSYPCSTYHPEHSNQHLSPAPFCRSSAQCAHFSLCPCLVGCGVPGTTGHALVLHTSPGHPAAHGSTGTHQFSHPCNVDVFGEPPKEGEGKPLMTYTSLFTRLISFPKRKEQLGFPTHSFVSFSYTLCFYYNRYPQSLSC